MLTEAGIAHIETGIEHLATLTFDHGAQGGSVDLRPALPLVLHF